MGIFDRLRKKTNQKAVFLGLDSAGKSTIISFLQEGRFVDHTPTMGKRKLEMEVAGTRISLIDMGGQASFRKMWAGELNSAKLVVFVIDKAAPHRFGELKDELDAIIPAIKESKCKLLVLGNKHDLPEAVDMGHVIESLELFALDNFELMEISARTGYGMADAFAKFYSMLTGEQVKRSKLTKAISVYNHGGTPIISQLDNLDSIERKAIEGGFLVAITQFCTMKLAEDGRPSIISFESEKNGTFLVGKSKNFIGSLLWTEDLDVPIKQSKSALIDLLEHLDSSCTSDDEERVVFHTQHYITNIL